MKIYLIVLIVTYYSIEVKAQCDAVCPTDLSIRNHVCVTETSFQLCKVISQAPTGVTYSCPQGTVCTNDASRCVQGQQPICRSQCGTCDSKLHITCLSKRIYAFCFNGKPDLNVNGTCIETEICNSEKPIICLTASTVDKPSCNQDSLYENSNIGNPSGDPIAFCQKINVPGRFSAGDKDCKQYIYCYPQNGHILGKLFTCPGATFFDCNLRTCGLQCGNNCNLQS